MKDFINSSKDGGIKFENKCNKRITVKTQKERMRNNTTILNE